MNYVYMYSWAREERSLCELEQRSFFHFVSDGHYIESTKEIDPSRSPFMRARLACQYEVEDFAELLAKVRGLKVEGQTFKVIFVKNEDEPKAYPFEERLRLARLLGAEMIGDVDMMKPELVFAVMHLAGRWVFGQYVKNEADWLKHQQKPHSYSTALGTRLARAVINIAAPNDGMTVIDPCCGMGTVLVEACSMGVAIVGSDLNRLVVHGARENLVHFGYNCPVDERNIAEITEQYDAAIVDLPYNICCQASPAELWEIIEGAARIAKRVVFIATEEIDALVEKAGLAIVDRTIAQKATFRRHVLVCERVQ